MAVFTFLRRLAAVAILIVAAPALADQGDTAPGPIQPISLTAVVVTGAKPLNGARFTVVPIEPSKSTKTAAFR